MAKTKTPDPTTAAALAAAHVRYDALIADANARLSEARHRVRVTTAEVAALHNEKHALPPLPAQKPIPALKAAARPARPTTTAGATP